MMKLDGVYKASRDVSVKDITLVVNAGNQISVECNQSTSNLLVDLIIGKQEPSRGQVSTDRTRVIFQDETYYENMPVKSYLRFYEKMYLEKNSVEQVMSFMGLRDLAMTRIKKLTLCQKRRLSYARELLSYPETLIVQEPLMDLDRDSLTLGMQAFSLMRENGVGILCLSVRLKDVLLTGDEVFVLDDNGLKEIKGIHEQQSINLQKATDEQQAKNEPNHIDSQDTINVEVPNQVEVTQFKVDKIQAKLEDRILLINPIEIDYVEVVQGECQLNVKGEKFPCPHSLTELEGRLLYLGFFRSHRSYLVNLQRVCEVLTWSRNSYSLGLDDKEKSVVPLSKGRLPELKNILGI